MRSLVSFDQLKSVPLSCIAHVYKSRIIFCPGARENDKHNLLVDFCLFHLGNLHDHGIDSRIIILESFPILAFTGRANLLQSNLVKGYLDRAEMNILNHK